MSSANKPKLDDCVCKLLRRTSRSVTNAYDKALAPSGLRTTQLTMLNTLSRMQTASVTELSEIMGLDQTTATRNLNVLEDSGLVTRVEHPDPRVKQVKLTAKGKQKRESAVAYWHDVQSAMENGLSEQEWKVFKQVLVKLESTASLFAE